MKVPAWFSEKGYYFGPATVYAWVVILICARLNPWWDWTASSQGALSYLGDPTLTPYAWVYDYAGMVPSGAMIAAFSIYLLVISRNRVEKAGSVSLSLAGLLLVLVGVFHQTPGPLETYHVAFSLWFFLQAFISMIFWGMGLWREGRRPLGMGMVSLAIGALFLDAGLSAAFGTPPNTTAYLATTTMPTMWWVWGAFLMAFGVFIYPAGISAALGGIRGKLGTLIGFVALAFGVILFLFFAGYLTNLGTLKEPIGEGVGAIILATGAVLFVAHVVVPSGGLRGGVAVALGLTSLIFGVLLFFTGTTVGLGGTPGATGEVLGILAITAWVFLMNFGKEARPKEASAVLPPSALSPGESPLVRSRPSLLHAIQVRALVYLGVGMFLFGFSDYYLTNHLTSLITGGLPSIIHVVEVTLATAILGYFLMLAGVWRWSKVLPRLVAYPLFALVFIFPLIVFFDWFSASGNEFLLYFFLVAGIIVPLVFSLTLWWRTRYAVTDQRVIALPFLSSPEALPVGDARSVSLDQGWIQRLADVGDVTFMEDSHAAPSPRNISTNQVRWMGVLHPHRTVAEAVEVLKATEVPPRKQPRHTLSFTLLFTVVVALVLVLTMVPVFQVRDTMNLNCALDLSNIQQLESDPWPYLHNVTLPPGHVTFHWWTGTPVWFGVLQLPQGIAYQNIPLSSLNLTSLGDLTTNGTGTFTAYGGTSLTGCIATTAGASATLEFTYDSPLVWA